MALNVGADAWWLENNTALERISPSRADSSTAYKDQVYVRSGASPGSPSARRIVGEHVEPRYIGEHHNTRSYDGYQDSYSARVSRERREVHYNGYQASYGAPVSRERREVQPHEVRIIGERDMRSTESHYPVQTQPVAVPTSRETYMPVDNNRVQTPHRERVSRPSSQPRSDSPERVDRHDHALYTENYLQSPQTTQVYVSSPSPQERVVIKEVPVVEYIEKIVKVPEYIEKIVEVPVEKIVERIITQPIRFSIPPSPKLAPQVIYSEPEIVRAEAIVVRQRDLVYEPQVVYQPQVTHQPQVTYRRQTNPDLSSAQQRKQVSREELYSRADEIFHSINKAPTIASSPNQSKAPSIASSPALGISSLSVAHALIMRTYRGTVGTYDSGMSMPCVWVALVSCWQEWHVIQFPFDVRRSVLRS